MILGLIIWGPILLLLAAAEARYKSYGGKYAHEGQFPYMMLLSYGGFKHCGASIFHERWAITAAHCLYDDIMENSLLTVGSVGDIGSGTPYRIEKFFVHPNYTLIPENLNAGLEYVVNDIGLIRLASKIVFNDKVRPITLATNEQNTYENSTGTLTGWGSDAYGEFMHDRLHYINVRILTPKGCQKVWTYADKHVCTSTQEKQGGCYGDSGSPLVVDEIQIGLLSTVDTYCESLKPDLYTKVASFLPWIKENLTRYKDELPVE